MRWTGPATVVVAAAIAYACGSDSNTKKDAGLDGKNADAHVDAPIDAHPDAPPDGPNGTFQLTVKNYLQWCTVRVGSAGNFSPAGVQTAFVLPGAVPLTAMANGSGFMMGSNMWHHVDADGSGSGVSGTQT